MYWDPRQFQSICSLHRKYIISGLVMFVVAEVLEGVNLSLLSRVMSSSGTAKPTENILKNYTKELSSMISFEEPESVKDNSLIRQPSPPPVLTKVQDVASALCPEVRELFARRVSAGRVSY